MKYLVLLTPAEGHAYDEFKPLLLEEQKAIWAAYRQGRLREWYIQFEPFTVTFIFEAESPESVSAELDRLPIVRAGLLEQKIVALGPWVQIEMLFDKSLMQSGASLPANPNQ
jgi:hypothetical protein